MTSWHDLAEAQSALPEEGGDAFPERQTVLIIGGGHLAQAKGAVSD
jgi:hypothetical protein